MDESFAYRCGRWLETTWRNLGYSYKIFREGQRNKDFSDYLKEQDGELHHMADELKVHRVNMQHLKDLCTKLDSSTDWREHGYWNSQLSQATRDVVHWTEQDDEWVYEIREEKKLRKSLEQHTLTVPHEHYFEEIQEHLRNKSVEEAKKREEADNAKH